MELIARDTDADMDSTAARFAFDRMHLARTRRSFRNINRERVARVHQGLTARQQEFLQLLPLLFHTNHPLMPGYAGQDCPSGIAGYYPDKQELARATRRARSFTFQRGSAGAKAALQGLYLMGSTGTIGQSSASDLDIWLCHSEELDAQGQRRLQEKAEAVSHWGATLGLEVHFFPMVASDFRAGKIMQLSAESSGTTQHHLLLDEFYRTALLLAGREPAWWLVPPEYAPEHAEYLEALARHRFISEEEVIDFGAVGAIPAAEFLGATLWQLYKGIAAPHKSVLKILLLESYAASYPETTPLSEDYKRAVYDGEHDLDRLDPYVQLLHKAERYLQAPADKQRLELARRCFYFKTRLALGARNGAVPDDWRTRLMGSLVEQWEWTHLQLMDLDSRHEWKIDRVVQEQRVMMQALTVSYRALSRFARANAETALVSQRDLTILGRKLFTVFEHKAGKVDIVTLSISKNLFENHLHIQQFVNAEDQEQWLLFRNGGRAQALADAAPLKRAWTLLEIVVWCHFNGLLGPNTRVSVSAEKTDADSHDIESLQAYLREHFPPAMLAPPEVSELARRPTAVKASTFVNLGVDPLENHSRRGNNLTTSRTDALSYSGWHENLVRVVDYLVVSSWREVLTFRYHGMDGLMACLCEHLRWVQRGLGGAADAPPCPSFATGYGDTISSRISRLFEQVSAWFLSPSAADHRRYIIRGGDDYHVLSTHGESVAHDFSGGFGELLRYLAQPRSEFTATTFDPHALEETPLPLIYETNREGVIQFYYRNEGKSAQILVLDECGALFVDDIAFHSEATLVGHYQRFFAAIADRRQVLTEGASTAGEERGGAPGRGAPPRAEFHRIVVGSDGAAHATRVEPPDPGDAPTYLSVQVTGESVEGTTNFRLFCNGREFSTLEHGGRLFIAAAAHVVAQRADAQRYPIYVTDIDLTHMDSQTGGSTATVGFLAYKRRVEAYLNRALGEVP